MLFIHINKKQKVFDYIFLKDRVMKI